MLRGAHPQTCTLPLPLCFHAHTCTQTTSAHTYGSESDIGRLQQSLVTLPNPPGMGSRSSPDIKPGKSYWDTKEVQGITHQTSCIPGRQEPAPESNPPGCIRVGGNSEMGILSASQETVT